MKSVPTIALRRRNDATLKFAKKLDVLASLLTIGDASKFPKRISVASFASWEDAELGVQKISRSIIYCDMDSYLALRNQMDVLLERLLVMRSRVHKKENKESILRNRLEDAEARAQSYVNQYSSAMAELLDARKEIARLNLRLSHQGARLSKVIPLHQVRDNATSEE